MCLIVLQEPGDPMMSKREFRDAWDDNPDGAGIIIVDDDGVSVRRAMGFRSSWRNYRMGSPGTLRIVHFRWGTSGSRDVRNVHPFRVGKRGDWGWMVHNGVMSAACADHPDRSDTAAVAAALQMLPVSAILSAGFRAAMDAMVGAGKMVIVDAAGEYHIIGEHRGAWDGARWYSVPQSRYLAPPPRGPEPGEHWNDASMDDVDLDDIIRRYAWR